MVKEAFSTGAGFRWPKRPRWPIPPKFHAGCDLDVIPPSPMTSRIFMGETIWLVYGIALLTLHVFGTIEWRGAKKK